MMMILIVMMMERSTCWFTWTRGMIMVMIVMVLMVVMLVIMILMKNYLDALVLHGLLANGWSGFLGFHLKTNH